MRQSAMIAVLIAACAAPASAQLRITQWNVTNYSGGRIAEFQTAIYASFEGRMMAPDVFLGEEFISQAASNTFLNLLNTAPGSPGDWAAAPFLDGPDTDDAFFYRTSKIDFLGVTTFATGGAPPNQPRNSQRYDIRLKGYTSAGATLACYPAHLKSGSATDDQARRLLETQHIRANSNNLPVGWNFLFGADTNIQTSTQAAYQELVGSQANNAGRFFDPINSPGNWNNNSAFRYIHTQDPAGAGGMDDRHDQILVSATLIDGSGFEYIGSPATPYSTTTWDDPNHSYRCWGNDGTSFDNSLTIAGNTMVGPDIAQALKTSATSGGHLPVYLDLRVPPKIDSETALDFGSVPVNSVAQLTLHVSNSADVSLWTAAGISGLTFTLAPSSGFSVVAGPFTDAAGAGASAHVVTMDTSAPGVFNGTITIASSSPEEPSRVVMLTGTVTAAPCPADLDGDGFVASSDLAFLLGSWGPGPSAADLDASGSVGAADLASLLGSWGPCP